MMRAIDIRKAIEANGGNPQGYRRVELLRQLVTTYGGVPVGYDEADLLRQAVTALGGTPVGYNKKDLYRQIIIAAGGNASFNFSDIVRGLIETIVGGPARLFISNATTAEGETLEFPVTRSGDPDSAVSATWTINFVTADAADLDPGQALTGTVSFAAGETSKTISVLTNPDTDVEADETLTVTLSDATNGALIIDAVAIGTITNNDVEVPPVTEYDVAQALQVYTDPAATGPVAGTTYKIPGVDPLPSGASYSASTGWVRITGACTLDGWRLTDTVFYITAGTETVNIRNCLVEITNEIGFSGVVDIRSTGPIYIDRCRFIGPVWKDSPTTIRHHITSTPTLYDWLEVTRCTFLGWGSDHIKCAGPGLIQNNLFDFPVNLPVEPTIYDAGVTYNTGDHVIDTDGKAYEALRDGLLGVDPSSNQNGTDWLKRDPHADNVNPYRQWDANRDMTVVENFFVRERALQVFDPLPDYGFIGWGVGLNNALRAARNSGDTELRARGIFASNVAAGDDAISYIIDFGGDDPNKTPWIVKDNLVSPQPVGFNHPNGINGGIFTDNDETYDHTALTPRAREGIEGVIQVGTIGTQTVTVPSTGGPLNLDYSSIPEGQQNITVRVPSGSPHSLEYTGS